MSQSPLSSGVLAQQWFARSVACWAVGLALLVWRMVGVLIKWQPRLLFTSCINKMCRCFRLLGVLPWHSACTCHAYQSSHSCVGQHGGWSSATMFQLHCACILPAAVHACRRMRSQMYGNRWRSASLKYLATQAGGGVCLRRRSSCYWSSCSTIMRTSSGCWSCSACWLGGRGQMLKAHSQLYSVCICHVVCNELSEPPVSDRVPRDVACLPCQAVTELPASTACTWSGCAHTCHTAAIQTDLTSSHQATGSPADDACPSTTHTPYT